jgi:hypothetical protein
MEFIDWGKDHAGSAVRAVIYFRPLVPTAIDSFFPGHFRRFLAGIAARFLLSRGARRGKGRAAMFLDTVAVAPIALGHWKACGLSFGAEG